jgi:NAD(P)-dependent dehydrogenase (short-subunit alcohol dehydrogenase family)
MTENTLQGKIVFITGASSGIGKVTARESAKLGATLVLVCRNQAKAEAVQAEIRMATGNQQIDLLLGDLTVQADVQRIVAEFLQKYDRLHVLINNAGGAFDQRQVTTDGLERTLALNYVAPFLLTELLLPTLKASAPARIVNVSSAMHNFGKINFADLQTAQRYGSMKAYGQAKLALVLSTYELARRLAGTGVTVNCLHPGMITSTFDINLGRLLDVGVRLMKPFTLNVDQGAQTTIFLATSPEVDGVSGKYFDKKKSKRSSSRSYDEKVAQELWEITDKQLLVY